MPTIKNEDLKKISLLLNNKRYFKDAKSSAELFADLYRINDKLEDSMLHLAIVGEFSSGKSTMINSLIGEKLLKSSQCATTASETHIRSGNTLKIQIELENGNLYTGTEDNPSPLAKAIELCGSSLPKIPGQSFLSSILHTPTTEEKRKRLKDLLAVLTTDNEVASKVRKCLITVPSKLPLPALDIIDTPGIGAGASAASFHSGVTQRVLEKEADAILVLTPSSKPVTASLISFVKSHLTNVLQRCVFLVTQSDQCDEDEIDEILAYVQKELKDKLGYTCEKILPICSVANIKGVDSGFFRANPLEYYQKEYQTAMGYIKERLNINREIFIRDKTDELFRALLKQINPALESWNDKIAEKLKILQTHRPESVEESMRKVMDEAKKMIAAEKRIQHESIKELVSDIAARLSNDIWENFLLSRIDSGCVPSSKMIAKKVQKKCSPEYKMLAKSVFSQLSTRPVLAQAENFINNAYLAKYDIIPKRPRRIKIPKPEKFVFQVPEVNNPRYDLIYEKFSKDSEAYYFHLLKINAVIFGIIGTCCAPVAGTLIGLLIAFVVSACFSASNDKKIAATIKADAKSAMWDYLNSFLHAYYNALVRVSDSWCVDVTAQLSSILSKIKTQYNEDVAIVLKYYQSEYDNCRAESAIIEKDLAWIEK